MRRMYSLKQLEEIASEQVKSVKKDISTLIDGDGHERFIEGVIETNEEGVSVAYGRWSLSGTHLMIVIGGTLAQGEVAKSTLVGELKNLPSWIYNKIFALKGTGVAWSTIEGFYADWSKENIPLILSNSSGKISVLIDANITLTGNCDFRASFDLLIDNN